MEDDLLATSHGIRGITNMRASILGALLIKITLGNKISRVMMYVCQEESGVILSVSPERSGSAAGYIPEPRSHVTVERCPID